ncbi:MAG: hypothetical protein JW723_00830 [Bacteroidales bacterium]|nr:hypothetical protein [Bacteroidales bacterium]
MRNISFALLMFILVSALQAQETEKKIWLKLFTPHWGNFEYVNGDVKEIHYQAYHVTDNEGEVVKGKPFTLAEAENVEMRKPWSLFFDKKGNIVSMALKTGEDTTWIGVVHSENDRIENIYWLRDDTLRINQKMVYDVKGKVIREWISYPESKVNSADTFCIDKNGNVIKVSYFDQDGKLVYTAEYTRNPDGSTKEMKGTDAEGKIKHYYTDYKYNDHGLFESYDMKLLNYEKPNFPVEITIYEYDNRGNWVKSIVRDWMMIERKIVYYE